ncbi:flagellar biosynthesis repressor FlbT [Bosea caraganae]|uniref:Flagellar biosynthesis repressor FlbT n=1 Tax=Bosea caraganae TaxID=2763117 RepID=A0A370LE99_9HYPH|nr:flagellar biosynthesis repressor FlbT [Bosea caraganae]RDJ29895.1 flagellar biosynthesis repressor FlbT [Bosea caraganae]
MKKSMHLSLRANEKIYVNGAILKVDRKVSVELLNDATFLLEGHVLQPDQTTTPLRQLYFVVQTMLIDPKNGEVARAMFDRMLMSTARIFEDRAILAGLAQIDTLVDGGRHFEALKQLRLLFVTEAEIVAREEQDAIAPAPEFPQFHSQVA